MAWQNNIRQFLGLKAFISIILVLNTCNHMTIKKIFISTDCDKRTMFIRSIHDNEFLTSCYSEHDNQSKIYLINNKFEIKLVNSLEGKIDYISRTDHDKVIILSSFLRDNKFMDSLKIMNLASYQLESVVFANTERLLIEAFWVGQDIYTTSSSYREKKVTMQNITDNHLNKEFKSLYLNDSFHNDKHIAILNNDVYFNDIEKKLIKIHISNHVNLIILRNEIESVTSNETSLFYLTKKDHMYNIFQYNDTGEDDFIQSVELNSIELFNIKGNIFVIGGTVNQGSILGLSRYVYLIDKNSNKVLRKYDVPLGFSINEVFNKSGIIMIGPSGEVGIIEKLDQK